MIFLVILVLGIAALFNITLEVSPNVEYPRLSISASWGGVSSEAVEAFLTSPMEAALSTVKGVKKISSTSYEGRCNINLEFHPSTDMDFARIEINEKLGALKTELPYGISRPRISPYIPKDFMELQGFLTYTLAANLSSNEIRKFAKENLVAPLMAIKGVSDVEVSGGNEREITITIDYDKTKVFNISNQEISSAIDGAEEILAAGNIERKSGRISVLVNNKIDAAAFLNYQPIKYLKDGTVIRLKDIGKIIDDFSERTSYYRINGEEAVFLRISKEPGANTVETADKVFAKLNELSKSFPADFQLRKEVDKSEDIRNELGELFSSAGYSLVMILLLLLIIFKRLNYSLIITASIAFSILASLLLFYLFNLSLNIITLASLVLGFGLIVDNSIVVIDYLDRHYSGRGVMRLAIYLKDIWFPVFASTLTTVAVFIPLLFLTGELKLYFEQFALAIVFSIGASLFVSFTVVPLFFYKFGYKHLSRQKGKNISLLQKIYLSATRQIVKRKKLSIAFLILLIGFPVWLLPAHIDAPVLGKVYNSIFDSDFYQEKKKYFNYALGGSLNLFFNYIPKGEVFSYGTADYIIVRLELPNGNKIERINNLTKSFEKEILAYKNKIGIVTANIINEENSYINVEFSKEQSGGVFPYLLKNYLTAFAVQLGGLNVSVFGYGPGFSSGGYSSSSFNVAVYGFNYKKVKEIAEEFREVITVNPRIDNVDIDRSSRYGFSKDSYEVIGKIKRENLAMYNIKPGEIFARIAQSSRGNISYNKFRIGNDEVPYNIKYTNYKEIQLNEIEEMEVKNSSEESVKIKDLINFSQSKVLTSINRENRQYVRYITFDYKGPYQYGREFINASIKQVSAPEGYEIKTDNYFFFMNQEEELEVWNILIFSAILIFMITASLFESFKKPFLIITAIPFAIIGVIFLFYFEELNLDRGAYAGLLLLIGISVNNSIVLVDYLSKNIIEGSIEEIIKLSFLRVRPIITTTLTTLAALLPIILFGENSFWKSLSYSVFGGLTFSAFFTIAFLPMLFHIFNNKLKF